MTQRKAAKGSPVAAVVAGEPTGRWAEVIAKTRASGKAIEPFDLTPDLILYPPTPKRAKAMGRATLAAQAAVSASVNAVRFGATAEESAEISDTIEAADLAYTKALIGEDQFDAVETFFEDKGEWERQAFVEALKRQFLRLPEEEGACAHCGHVTDEAEAGKELGSSTSSSTTGMSSRETSPSTSESEPETGATTGPGTSS